MPKVSCNRLVLDQRREVPHACQLLGTPPILRLRRAAARSRAARRMISSAYSSRHGSGRRGAAIRVPARRVAPFGQQFELAARRAPKCGYSYNAQLRVPNTNSQPRGQRSRPGSRAQAADAAHGRRHGRRASAAASHLKH